ncbi:MAG TPA: methionyl-tRNA formyltransferase [Methylomirabilota bacterium]
MLFYGTPAFALPTLEGLLAHHHVVAVITQPDKPAGRGRALATSVVKRRALEASLPVLQPPRLRDAGWPERLAEYRPDVGVVAAFGQILPKAVLDVPARGSINVHGSILPRYRGAAPIAWAIMRGETETGITTFQMDAGMDTGDMLLREAAAIGPEETAGELSVRLAEIGARLLLQTLESLGSLPRIPQDPAQATLAPRLKKEDGWLRPTEPARDLVNRVRGCNPWPGAALMTPGGRLLIWRAKALPSGAAEAPGTLVSLSPPGRGQGEGPLAISTGQGLLLPTEVQPENRKAMPWADFLRGARLRPGARVSEPTR